MIDKLKALLLVGVVIALGSAAVSAQIATGGSYSLNKAAISNGGGNSTGGTYGSTGTSGQSAAGTNSSGGAYSGRSGFWFGLLAPTAATSHISGMIASPDGTGLGNVEVSVTGGSLSAPRIARTNQLGRFVIDELEVGEFYIVTVTSQRYFFPQPNQIVFLNDVAEVVFTSN